MIRFLASGCLFAFLVLLALAMALVGVVLHLAGWIT